MKRGENVFERKTSEIVKSDISNSKRMELEQQGKGRAS